MVKKLPAMWDTWVLSLGRKIPWRRAWRPTPVFLPGKSNGQRSLAGYSPQGGKESDTTELCMHTHCFGLLLNSIVVGILFFSVLSLLKAHHLDGCSGLMAEISFVY